MRYYEIRDTGTTVLARVYAENSEQAIEKALEEKRRRLVQESRHWRAIANTEWVS